MRESIHPTDRTQALQLTKFGDPGDSVSLVSRHTRQPVAGKVLIDLHGAPVHPSDIHLIRGFYGLRPELPMDLGADGVGTVVEAGSAADRGLIGRRVILMPTYEHGTWAGKTVTDGRNTVVVDDEADLMQLAMLGVTPITAQLLLTKYARSSNLETGSPRPALTPRSASTSSSLPAWRMCTPSISYAERPRRLKFWLPAETAPSSSTMTFPSVCWTLWAATSSCSCWTRWVVRR